MNQMWRDLQVSTSEMKKFFPELRNFSFVWKNGCWNWKTTSMIMGRLPLNGEYMGRTSEVESELCDCESGCVETLSHFLFDCPVNAS
mmetsp:Transcript_6675/g.10066  ORF Transcript_6675/g.10066 Transcript_6675/m.10066 type:complete len:87 (-) Transcript_6675:31-291(-)